MSISSIHIRFVGNVAASVLLSLVVTGLPVAAQNIVLQGSTTFNASLLVPHQAAIESASKQRLTIIPNKSSLGLSALFDGRADLAMISSSLESAVELLRQSRPDLQFDELRNFPIARTRVAFVVNSINPVRSASLEMLRQVLLGEITNWKELGGPDLPIRVVRVRNGGGVQFSVEAELLGGKEMSPANPIIVQIGTQVVKVVEQEPSALGLAQLGETLDRRVPELLTERSIVQQLNLVSLREPTPPMMAVIDSARRVATLNLK